MRRHTTVHRREFLKGSLLTTLAAGVARGGEPKEKRRPNLVIVLADDHGIGEVGCYGNKVVHTPNIDRLANRGLRFTRAFTATAMCTPSRSMLYTGLFPHRNGAHRNHSAVDKETKSLPHYLGALGYRVVLAGKRHIKPRPCFPFDFLNPHVRMRHLDPVLKETVETGTPLCLVVALHDPHTPWKRKGPHKPEEVPIPPTLVDTPKTREAMARYYNSVTAADARLGGVRRLLDKHGLDDSTLLIYTSDHGNGFPFNKWTCYEAGLNVPFIVRWPGHTEAGATTDAMVSFPDVLPTLLKAAGGEPVPDLDGRSFLPVIEGETERHREFIFGTHTTQGIISGSVYPVRSIRSATHKYIVNLNAEGEFRNIITEGRPGKKHKPPAYWQSWLRKAETDEQAAERVRAYQHRPPEELYDLRSDPHELHNLAEDPSQRPLMERLRRRLLDWMRGQGDPLVEKMTS